MVRPLCRAHEPLAARLRLELYSEERPYRPRAARADVAALREKLSHAISHYARRQLSATRVAHRPREARRPLSAARARKGALAGARALSRRGAGRRDGARHPRAGAGG